MRAWSRMPVPVATVLMLGAADASAAAPVRIDYAAPASCPSQLSFERELTTRAHNVHVTDDASERVVVHVEQRGGRFDGTLSLREAGGAAATRSVSGATCAEVVNGLALIAALALDGPEPDDHDAGKSSSIEPKTTASSTTTTQRPPASVKPEAPTGTKPTTLATPTTSSSEPSPDATTTTHPLRAFSIALGAHGGVVTGIAPSVTPTIAFFVDLAKTGDAVLSPSLRLRFERAGDSSDPFAQGAAHFTWTEGGIDGCPVVWAPIARLRLAPCLRAEAGIVEASGVDASPARSQTRPWLLLGAVGRGQLRLVGPVFIELEMALYAPLVRDRFYLEPDTTVFRASAIAWGGSAGLGVTIW
ncbi:MAG: hypothetical protein ABI551_07935 [Polyangiaceae bacterium]